MIAEFSMYLDIRNLEVVGIRWTEGRLDASGVISFSRNGEQLGSFVLFARELLKHAFS